MKMLFVSIETTGLKPGEICQLSCITVDTTLKQIIGHNKFFQVNEIPDETSKINGYTVDLLSKLSEGRKISSFKKGILKCFKEADIIITQDVDFLVKFIKKELLAPGEALFKENQKYVSVVKIYAPIMKKKTVADMGYSYVKLTDIITKCLGFNGRNVKALTKRIYPDINTDTKETFSDSRYKAASLYLAIREGVKRGYFTKDLKVVNK